MEDEYTAYKNLPRTFIEKLRSGSINSKTGINAAIFRVPENIRRTNVDSFEPKMVSLGPYHHGKQRFRATDERIKLPYASNFFGRMDVDLVHAHRFVDQSKYSESDFRRAYSEQISMTSSEFVEMMVLDCAFLAEFLREQAGGHRTRLEEYNRTQMEEYSWKWAAPLIANDMMLVENQLPLRHLRDLFKECTDEDEPSETGLVCFALMQQIHRNLSPTMDLHVDRPTLIDTSAHLLHLFHSLLVRGGGVEKAFCLNTVDLPSFPSAEMLQAMRIHFTNKTDGWSFLDITFDESKRSMEIPQLLINDDNISLLRNLIAFEQQYHWAPKYISTYVWFMDCLINTDKDVAVLRQHKIIISRLRTDEEVAHIFNELRRTDTLVVDFDLEHFYLAEVISNVESYCRKRSNRLWALWNFSWLRQNYFKNRWVTIGVTAVVFFNLLSLVQTVYAILSYAKQ